MSNVTPLRVAPEVMAAFQDTRGDGRALRVTWHHEPAPHGPIVLLSLWRGDQCAASFRLSVDEVPELIAALRAGLDKAYVDAQGAAPVSG